VQRTARPTNTSRFMVPMHAKNRKEAFQDRVGREGAQSAARPIGLGFSAHTPFVEASLAGFCGRQVQQLHCLADEIKGPGNRHEISGVALGQGRA